MLPREAADCPQNRRDRARHKTRLRFSSLERQGDVTAPRCPGPPLPRPASASTPLHPPFHLVLVEPGDPPQHRQHRAPRCCDGLPLAPRREARLPHRRARKCAGQASTTSAPRRPAPARRFRALSSHSYGAEHPSGHLHLFSGIAPRSYLEVAFDPGDALVFGKESVGLPEQLMTRFAERLVAIPTMGGVRVSAQPGQRGGHRPLRGASERGRARRGAPGLTFARMPEGTGGHHETRAIRTRRSPLSRAARARACGCRASPRR